MASVIEEIKRRLDIVQLVGSYIRLDKAGANFKALCPFHNEKLPSFYVSPAREIWHCFGCGAGGDIFRFVSQIEGVEFPEALEMLALRSGVALRKEDPRLLTERKRLFSLLEGATQYFVSELQKRKDVWSYLNERGLKDETIKSFRLGYAPQSWDGVINHLTARGFRPEEIERAGLAVLSSNPETRSKFYDRFRARIIFPIWDASGRVVGFSGRIFEKDARKDGEVELEGAKYINTPQTVLYDKSKVLYLWNRAKDEIRKEGASVLVEGQLDALMSHQAGVINAVATSGTSLGREHLRLIKRLASKLFLAFDPDQAGEIATRRAVELALELGLDVNIISLPKGKDPAETIRQGVEIWEEAVLNAKPIIAFFLGRLKEKFPDDLRLRRSEAKVIVLPYLARVENEIEKAHWVQETSKVLALSEEPLWEELKKAASLRKKEASEADAGEASKFPSKTRRDLLEERILGMLSWKKGKFLGKLCREAQEFFSAHNKPLLECVLKEKFPSEARELKDKLEKLSLEAELLYGEMPASPDASRGGERVHEEFHNLIKELEKESVRLRLEEITQEIRKLEAEEDKKKILEHLEEFNRLAQKLNRK
jgi:DNA primase